MFLKSFRDMKPQVVIMYVVWQLSSVFFLAKIRSFVSTLQLLKKYILQDVTILAGLIYVSSICNLMTVKYIFFDEHKIDVIE